MHAMKVYFHEHGRRSFYCATAPTASENAERFCEMAALRSKDKKYNRSSMYMVVYDKKYNVNKQN